jgi:Ser/Thr protein kinase RdoA (MazF antagonist)
MTVQSPDLPSPGEWLHWGVSEPVEVHGGKQSRVVAAIVDGQKVAVKLTDKQLADEAALDARMRAVEALSVRLSNVVPPIRIDGEFIQPIGGWLMTTTPWIDGDRLDVATSDDARTMGRTLALLHQALASLPACEIPPVAALASVQPDAVGSPWQLLHGDFSDQNLIATPALLRVFDFDDCGYGPIEYDLANSLYMVFFETEVNAVQVQYEQFRTAFLAGYVEGARHNVDETIVSEMITLRINALGRWLEDLESAPIGIRTLSAEWQEKLRLFVRSQESKRSG